MCLLFCMLLVLYIKLLRLLTKFCSPAFDFPATSYAPLTPRGLLCVVVTGQYVPTMPQGAQSVVWVCPSGPQGMKAEDTGEKEGETGEGGTG